MARWIFCIGCIWVTSLVVTAWAAWHLASRDDSAAPPARIATPSPPTAPADHGGELASENQGLREQVESLQAKNLELGRKYFHLSLQQWADENKAENTPPEDIAALWDRQMEQMRSRPRTLDFEDRLNLMFAFAAYGKAGVAELSRVLNDHNRHARERETALQLLRYMNTREAFDAVLDFRDPELTELDYPYDLILNQLKTMQTSTIQDRFPEIDQQIGRDLGSDKMAPERVEVLLTLASTHHDAQAQRLLRDPRILQESLGGALSLAETLDTPVARDFVTFVRANRKNWKSQRLAANPYGR